MSSPPDSITDIVDESALNKKRGRAQSVEPAAPQDINDDVGSSQEASLPTVSAPKKTKRDGEDNSTTVSAIRRNMKDMSTTDDIQLVESQSTGSDSQDDELMGTIAEEEDSTSKKNSDKDHNNLLAKFGGGSKDNDDDDWAEFAEDEEETNSKSSTAKTPVAAAADDKPKYAFGASSGFGTKGWAASHQTIPTPSKQPTFGGFGSSSGFGGFKSVSQPSLNDNTAVESKLSTSMASDSASSTTSSVPTFGSFANATASPFAAAAAAGSALSSSNTDTKSNSPVLSSTTSVVEKESNSNESDNEDTNTPTAFGEGAKVKVPGIRKQTEVKTGEEDEDTIFQTKAKLLVLDTASGNWKERGVGTFRINMREEETRNVLQTRLVMRTDSVYRVILNLLLFEGMKVFIMQDKFVRFAGFEKETKEDGTVETKLISYALKLSNPSVAHEVCERITEHIPRHTTSSQP